MKKHSFCKVSHTWYPPKIVAVLIFKSILVVINQNAPKILLKISIISPCLNRYEPFRTECTVWIETIHWVSLTLYINVPNIWQINNVVLRDINMTYLSMSIWSSLSHSSLGDRIYYSNILLKFSTASMPHVNNQNLLKVTIFVHMFG